LSTVTSSPISSIPVGCFGEDFATWLKQGLTRFSDLHFDLSEPIQEDYGWAFGHGAATIHFGLLFPTLEMDLKRNQPNGLSQLRTIQA